MHVVYAILCIAGTALPLSQFIPWLSKYGLNVPLLFSHATASEIAAFGWSDVLVTGVVVAVFIVAESARTGMRHGWLALAGLLIGPSLALPLFLLLRERRIAPAHA